MIKFKQVTALIINNKYLVLILLIAAALRFVGIYPGYNPYHSDEPAIYVSALKMASELTYDPGRYDYPATLMTINAIFYKLLFIPIHWAGYFLSYFLGWTDSAFNFPTTKAGVDGIFNLYIVGAGNVNAIFWGRYVTAVFGVGTVFLIYLLGKKLFSKEVGLLAAFLLVFNFKHVVNSHLALPDIYNSFFLLLSILTTLRLFEKQSLKNYILAGIAAGVSFSVKYQVYAILPLVLTYLLICLPKTKVFFKSKNSFASLVLYIHRYTKTLFRPGIFVALLLIPIIFAVLNPFYLLHFEQARAQHLLDFERYRFGINQLNLYPLWYMYHFDYGAPQLILFAIGLVWAVFKEFKKTLILLGPIALFFYIFFYYSAGGFFIRNIITTTPLLLIFVAFAVWNIYLKATKKFPKWVANLLLVFCLVIVIYVPAKNSFISAYNYTKPWNYVVMSDWLKANLPQDAIVASDPWDLLAYGPVMKRTEFGVQTSYSLAEHQENGATWALINSHWSPGHFYAWMMFGADHLDYWNKPMEMLRNNYYGIATEEFFHYQAFAATKPWQAAEANLIITKLPIWPNVEMNKMQSFTFDKSIEDWKVIAKDSKNSADYIYDSQIGRDGKGSIRYIPGGARYSVTRIVSPSIKIKQGRLYKISGFIKLDQKLPSIKREGYIRVDFYGLDFKPEERGILTSVSARVYGSTDWIEKDIIERAPEGAEYMIISFSNSQHSQPIMWLDDIVVEESKESVDDITSKTPYNKRDIDLNPFYPNSHGNL